MTKKIKAHPIAFGLALALYVFLVGSPWGNPLLGKVSAAARLPC